MSTGPDTLAVIKERATIVCRQRSSVLLVARTTARWSLPGGTIRRGETPLEAARRNSRRKPGSRDSRSTTRCSSAG